MAQYKSVYGNKYDSTQSFYNFVKVECTSTYPRLTFIIKFLPILNGVSLIHVYSQNKLSRQNDPDNYITQIKGYKEFDIIYGSEIKNLSNIEFRYTEPKKLKEIERFFIEFYLSIVNKFGLFYNPSLDMKYYDNSLILIIDEVINQNRNSTFETVLSKINSKFYECYLKGEENDKVRMIEKFKDDKFSNFLVTGNTNPGNNFLDASSQSALDLSMKRIGNNK